MDVDIPLMRTVPWLTQTMSVAEARETIARLVSENEEHYTPLQRAMTAMRDNFTPELIDPSLDMEAVSPDGGETALTFAVRCLPLAATTWLLDRGANVHRFNEAGHTALGIAAGAARWACGLALMNALLDAGASPDAVRETWPPLAVAIGQSGTTSSLQAARLLLQRGANPNMGASTRNSPLMAALAPDAPSEAVQLLLDAGADPNDTTMEGDTAAMIAVVELTPESSPDQAEKVRLLFQHTDMSIINACGSNLLHGLLGVQIGEDECVPSIRELLQMAVHRGADPTLVDEDEDSPLSMALEIHAIPSTELLALLQPPVEQQTPPLF